MRKIHLECDYAEGAHQKILERLGGTNLEQTCGYGDDKYSKEAKNKIRYLCNNQNIDIHFVAGGTLANLIVISSILRPYEGVISPESGHINVHETGAIEATGHKILAIPDTDGKITASEIEKLMCDYENDGCGKVHCVKPGMVYISHPNENGLNYTKNELKKIYDVCKKYNLPLFIDGARVGYGLVAQNSDLSLSDVASLCDVFIMGGTKIGALFGEAIVISNHDLQKGFIYNIKQRGGLMAKGRILGIQFDTLFENNLYFNISKHAVDMAMNIKNAFAERRYKFLYDSYTNQQFPILPNDKLEILSKYCSFCKWKELNSENTAVRICTSWATNKSDVSEFIEVIKKYL